MYSYPVSTGRDRQDPEEWVDTHTYRSDIAKKTKEQYKDAKCRWYDENWSKTQNFHSFN